MSLKSIGYKYSLVKRIIYSIILFVGAICVCKRVKKWGGLTKTLLIGGLITLIAGVLLGLGAYLAYGFALVANPAKTCMFVAMVLVTVAEQIVIFQKDTSEE